MTDTKAEWRKEAERLIDVLVQLAKFTQYPSANKGDDLKLREVRAALLAHLDAAGETMAPSLSDEREAFEAAWLGYLPNAELIDRYPPDAAWIARSDLHVQGDRLSYCERRTRDAYFGWQARALLAAPHEQPDKGHQATDSVACASTAAMLGWQPIATAPKDGTEVLAWREDCGVMMARYTCADSLTTTTDRERDETDEETLFQEDWFGGDSELGGFRLEGSEVPTHWMPLPGDPGDSFSGATQPNGNGLAVASPAMGDQPDTVHLGPPVPSEGAKTALPEFLYDDDGELLIDW